MIDYGELVKALRSASTVSTAWEKLMRDAAAAIEALQAEHKKTVTQIFGEEQQEWEEYCTGLMNRIMELKAQLPKRGEWVEDTTTYYAGPGRSNYKCSLCGKICGTWRRGLKPSELPNWCGNCGADMRANMEVQDGK